MADGRVEAVKLIRRCLRRGKNKAALRGEVGTPTAKEGQKASSFFNAVVSLLRGFLLEGKVF